MKMKVSQIPSENARAGLLPQSLQPPVAAREPHAGSAGRRAVHAYDRGMFGFSLLELMIVVAVIGVLAAIAIPSYTSYALKSKRVEGQAALTDGAARQERYYSDNFKYTKNLSALGMSKKTENGYYKLSVKTKGKSPQQYTFSAVPTFTDTKCQTLTIDHTGARSRVAKGKNTKGLISARECWGGR